MKKEYTNSQIKALIEEHVHSERDRSILINRFINGYTYQELASKYYLSESQIKRIVKKADRIFLHL